jgi:tetratricopeptide (TPR) repeat protein
MKAYQAFLLLNGVSMCFSNTALGQVQSATATGPCAIAIINTGNGSTAVSCYARRTPNEKRIVDGLVQKAKENSRAVKNLGDRVTVIESRLEAGELRDTRQDEDLAKVGDDLNNLREEYAQIYSKKDDVDATPGERQAAAELEGGNATKAAALLGREAKAQSAIKPEERATAVSLYIQQASLLQTNDIRGALVAIEKALALDPDNFYARLRAGELATITGQIDTALVQYRQLNAIARLQSDASPNNPELLRWLSISQDRIGDTLVAKGDTDGALASFQKSLSIRKPTAADDPGNVQLQRDLSFSYSRVGDTLAAKGDFNGALISFQESLLIDKRFADKDPGNADWQRDIFLMNYKIGNLFTQHNDPKGALVNFRESLLIAKIQADKDNNNTDWQSYLFLSQQKIGESLSKMDDKAGALSSFQDSLLIAERLAKRDPNNADWQRYLSLGHERIGDVLAAQGDAKSALVRFRTGLSINERLVKKYPNNVNFKYNIFYINFYIGEFLVKQNDTKRALPNFRDCLTAMIQLVEKDPSNADWLRLLGVSYGRLAIEDKSASISVRRAGFDKAIGIFDGLIESGRGVTDTLLRDKAFHLAELAKMRNEK